MNSNDQIPFSELSKKFFAIRVRWKRNDNGNFVGPVRFLYGVRRASQLKSRPMLHDIRDFKTKGAANKCRKLEAVQVAHGYLSWDPKLERISMADPDMPHIQEQYDHRLVPIHAVIEVVEIERVTTTRIEAVLSDEPVLDRLADI